MGLGPEGRQRLVGGRGTKNGQKQEVEQGRTAGQWQGWDGDGEMVGRKTRNGRKWADTWKELLRAQTMGRIWAEDQFYNRVNDGTTVSRREVDREEDDESREEEKEKKDWADGQRSHQRMGRNGKQADADSGHEWASGRMQTLAGRKPGAPRAHGRRRRASWA